MVDGNHDRQPIEAELAVNPDHFPVAQRQTSRRAEIAEASNAQTEDDNYEGCLDELLQYEWNV